MKLIVKEGRVVLFERNAEKRDTCSTGSSPLRHQQHAPQV